MKPLREGQLVTVTEDGVTLDGIVVHRPTMAKLVVAVAEADAEPALRTVPRTAVRERSRAGDHDTALRRLMGKASAAARGGPQGGKAPRPGHTRAPAHRSPGR
jgi:hypothetical protein